MYRENSLIIFREDVGVRGVNANNVPAYNSWRVIAVLSDASKTERAQLASYWILRSTRIINLPQPTLELHPVDYY